MTDEAFEFAIKRDVRSLPEPVGLRLSLARNGRKQLLAAAEHADRVARSAVIEHSAQRGGRLQQREHHARILGARAHQDRHTERSAPVR